MKNKQKKKGRGRGNAGFLVDPLTPRQFRRERRADVNLQTRPLARQLRSEKKASLYRERQEIPSWFNDYRNVLAGNQQASQANYQQALGGVSDFSNQLAQHSNAAREAEMARMQADAVSRGTTVNPGVAQGSIASADSRDRLNTSLYGTIAGQGANQSAYLGNRIGIAAQQGIAARQEEAARRAKITEHQRTLARERGDLRAKYRSTARESERKWYLENKALQGDRASNATQRYVADAYSNQHKTVDVNNNYSGNKSKDKGGISAGEARGMAKEMKPKKGWKSKQQIYNKLVNRGVDGKIARKVAARIWANAHPKYDTTPFLPGG